MASQEAKRHFVIVGGGIIGSTTAYFLTRHPKFNPALHRITLLEATAIASGASGKAGGLLALWAYPACLVSLSYRIHADLAREHGGADRWGYRRVGCGSLSATVAAKDLATPAPTTSNGSAAEPSAELPIQASVQGGNSSGAGAAKTEDDGKDWEKLPKQDQDAVRHLQDSLLPADLGWINGDLVQYYQEMGSPGTTETSQVHPYLFTTSIAALAQERGADIRLNARVTKIHHSKTDVSGLVEYLDRQTGEARRIEDATDVVVTAGPWTGRLLPRSRVDGLRAHSVVFQADVSPYAVFTDIQLPADYAPKHRADAGRRRKHRANVDPEIYARPNGEVYACGEPDRTIPLPETADLVQCDEAQCDDLIAYIGTISPLLRNSPVKAKQSCYLPRHIRFDKEQGPLIGRTVVEGLWVAAGHTCWGIQNGPATGLLMSEMLLDGEASSSDISSLDPRKFKV